MIRRQITERKNPNEGRTKIKKESFPIYIVAGEDDALVDIEIEKITHQFLKPEQRELGLIKMQGKEAVISDCLDELRTLPFLASRRVVVIKDADKFISENRQFLEDYFEKPSPTGVLVLTVGKLDSRTNLARKLSCCGKLVSIKTPNRHTLPAQLTRYAEQMHGKKLSQQAAELVIELSGEDVGRLFREIDKLAAYSDAAKEISIEDIESLTGHNRLFDAFEVFDKALSGKAAAAIERFRDMLAKDKTAQYSVVGAFIYQVRRMFDAKVLLDRGTSAKDIVNRLRIFGNSDAFFGGLKKMNIEQVGILLEQLGRIDYQVKTGRSSIDVEMEKFILRLANQSKSV
jgi:DNA polymerase-3 subunit delta